MSCLFETEIFSSLEMPESEQRFPAARIFCAGRNYAGHGRETGGDPNREAPFFSTMPVGRPLDTRKSPYY